MTFVAELLFDIGKRVIGGLITTYFVRFIDYIFRHRKSNRPDQG